MPVPRDYPRALIRRAFATTLQYLNITQRVFRID